MPTFVHGKSTGINFAEFNLAPYFNSASVSREAETAESTAFGSTSRSYIVGQKTGTVSVEGMLDSTEDAVDEVLTNVLGSDNTSSPLTLMSGGTTTGKTCVLALPNATSYEISSPVSEIVAVSAEFQSNSNIDNGVVLAGNTAVTTTASTGSSVDNAASSANGGVAHLHVTANTSNGSAVAKVQHSADNSTWADLVTFTTIGTGTATSQRSITAAGTTVNRYLRALITPAGSSGSLTVTVAYARR